METIRIPIWSNNYSKEIGSVSIQTALQISRVESIQWCLSMTGKILDAYFLNFGSCLASISISTLSIADSPSVSPDIKPAIEIRPTEIPDR